MGGPRAGCRALTLGVLAETPDITIEELRHRLAGRGPGFSRGTIQRFLVRHRMTRKRKTGHASEQDLADALERRQAWRAGEADLEPARLVFIDETWARTNMTRACGRAPKGRRLRMGQPHSHRKTTTFVLDGPIDRPAFETCVDEVLVPELRAGDIVVMDTLSSHKGAAVRESVGAAGAELLFLPP